MTQDDAKARVLAQVARIRERQQGMSTERIPNDLHRLAFEYRNARQYTEAVAAWSELERYVQAQVEKSFQAGRAFEAGLKMGSWLAEQREKNQVETKRDDGQGKDTDSDLYF